MPGFMICVDAILLQITKSTTFTVDARFLQQVQLFQVNALLQANELTEFIGESAVIIDPNTASNTMSETSTTIAPNQASNSMSETSTTITPNQESNSMSETSAMITPNQESATMSEDSAVFVLSLSQPLQFRVGAIIVP